MYPIQSKMPYKIMPCSFCIICTIQPVNIWMSISLLASNTRSTLSVCTIFQHPCNVIECPPLKFPYLSPPILTHPSLPTCQTPPKCLPFPPVKPHPSNCPSPVLTGTNIMICKYDDITNTMIQMLPHSLRRLVYH